MEVRVKYILQMAAYAHRHNLVDLHAAEHTQLVKNLKGFPIFVYVQETRCGHAADREGAYQ